MFWEASRHGLQLAFQSPLNDTMNMRVPKLEEDINYELGNKLRAFQKAQEWGERIPIGIIYKREIPTFEEQLPALRKGPFVKQQLAPAMVGKLLDEFM